jgi:basic amino acid/polyamine antiporter, APA family
MAAAGTSGARSQLDVVVAAAEADRTGLVRSLGPVSLGAIGIATIVGAGIFVLTGEAAATHAGPGIALSFVISGIAAGLSALCYAELASMIPVSGSAYTFAYLTIGPFLAWVIGWDLVLEYLLGACAVAVGWGGYVVNLLTGASVELPAAITNGPLNGGVVNVPAVLIVVVVSGLLIMGTRESARVTVTLVAFKLLVLALFVVVGASHVDPSNWSPFIPPNEGAFGDFGVTGVITAAGAIFFSYLGFDIVCNAAQEARDPRRTVPIGILGSLVVAVVLYVAVSLVLTGLASYRGLDVANPLSAALGTIGGLAWLRNLIDVTAVAALGVTVLGIIFAQTRVLMRMSEDGMLPRGLGTILPRTGTPARATVVVAVIAIVVAGLLPIETLGDLVSVGALAAFMTVAVAVLVMRRTRPDAERGFRVPLGLLLPVLAIVIDLVLILTLPPVTLLRFLIWLVIGLTVYFTYARSRSRRVAEERAATAPA